MQDLHKYNPLYEMEKDFSYQRTDNTYINKLNLLKDYLDVDEEWAKEREKLNPYKEKPKVVFKKKTNWRHRFDDVKVVSGLNAL